jgi:GNAT superfamily N-acetyltransferase
MRAAIERDVVATRLTNVDVPVAAHLEDDVAWAVSAGSSAYRCTVVRAVFADDAADRRIDEILAVTDAAGSPVIWWHADHHRPADLHDRLLRHGFHQVDTTEAMALDLGELPSSEGAPAGLVIRPVATGDDARAYVAVIEADRSGGSQPPPGGAEQRIRHVTARIGLDPAPMRFVGWVEGTPVATARLSVVGGVAGVYAVVTIPSARGQGFGRAMTRHALEAGRTLGMQIATLQATALGLPVYRRLGFRTYFEYRLLARPASR